MLILTDTVAVNIIIDLHLDAKQGTEGIGGRQHHVISVSSDCMGRSNQCGGRDNSTLYTAVDHADRVKWTDLNSHLDVQGGGDIEACTKLKYTIIIIILVYLHI